ANARRGADRVHATRSSRGMGVHAGPDEGPNHELRRPLRRAAGGSLLPHHGPRNPHRRRDPRRGVDRAAPPGHGGHPNRLPLRVAVLGPDPANPRARRKGGLRRPDHPPEYPPVRAALPRPPGRRVRRAVAEDQPATGRDAGGSTARRGEASGETLTPGPTQRLVRDSTACPTLHASASPPRPPGIGIWIALDSTDGHTRTVKRGRS